MQNTLVGSRDAMVKKIAGFIGRHCQEIVISTKMSVSQGLYRKFGKWSPSWEGPYKIVQIVPGNSYFVQSLQGEKLPKALNGRYLKKYYPSMWQEA